MAFEPSNFTPIGGQALSGNAPGLWSYQSSVDSLADVLAAGYFDKLGSQLYPGDFITASLVDGKLVLTVEGTAVSPPSVAVAVMIDIVSIPDEDNFFPDHLDDLNAWLDATVPEKIIDSGGIVSEWRDRVLGIPETEEFANYEAGGNPKTGVATINGLNAISIDVLEDSFKLVSVVPEAIKSWLSGCSVFMVVRSKSAGSDGNDFGVYFDDFLDITLSKDTDDSKLNLEVSFNGSNGSFQTASVFSGGEPTIIGLTYSASNVTNLPQFYKNGAPVALGPVTVPTGGYADVQIPIVIGNSRLLNNSVDSDIGEFILYDRILSNEEITLVSSYLSDKWAIPLS